MALNDIRINGVLVTPYGRKFTEGHIEKAREDRTASGRLTKDIVAVKRKFRLDYDLIDESDFLQFQNWYESGAELTLQVRRPDNSFESFTVLPKPMERERVASVGMRYWTGVTLELEEV